MFPKMLWILIPTIWAILLMELYFDRYSREGLGHHMSLENTMFLLFISANILFISIQHPIVFPKLVLSIAFIIFSIIVGMMDFFHKLPTKLVLKGSSKFVVAFISYCTIILVYSDILLNLTILKFIYTLFALILLFLTFTLIVKLISFFEPKSYEEIEHFLKNIEEDIKKTHEESIKEFGDLPKKTSKPKKTNSKKKKIN